MGQSRARSKAPAVMPSAGVATEAQHQQQQMNREASRPCRGFLQGSLAVIGTGQLIASRAPDVGACGLEPPASQ